MPICHVCKGPSHELDGDSVCPGSREEARKLPLKEEAVNHPDHYGGKANPYEAIKVIEAWNLGFCLGNTVKYISRAGKKDPTKTIQDLEKAQWYLERRIKQLKDGRP